MAGLLKDWVPGLDTPAPNAFATVGVAVIWVGLAVRVRAVIKLGGSLRTPVEVDADQAVVTSGPYRWVRHPSYTGAGLGFGIWLCLLICAVNSPVGLLPRIAVEESEMTRVLGES